MEGLRGFAVFLVFLVHYVTLIDPWISNSSYTFYIGDYLRSIGNSGVDLFFVLSGFLIYGTLIEKKKNFTAYLKRRIIRIYPAFIAVFMIYLIVSYLYPMESKVPGDWGVATLYLIQNLLLLPGLFDIEPIITVAWSLSYEFFYYLFIPIFIGLLSFRSWDERKRLVFIIIFTLVLFVFFYFNKTHIRMVMFVSGILLFEIIKGRQQNIFCRSYGLIALLAACCFMVIFKQHQIDHWWRVLTLFVAFLILCLDVFGGKSFVSQIFSYSPLRWFGNISYSYYLIHGLSLKAGFMVFSHVYPPSENGSLLFWWLLVPMFLLTLVPSVILFTTVEKPFSLSR